MGLFLLALDVSEDDVDVYDLVGLLMGLVEIAAFEAALELEECVSAGELAQH